MPFDKSKLKDPLASLFAGPSADVNTGADECAQAWADAIDDYMGDITPPIAGAGTALAAAAKGALQVSLAAAYKVTPQAKETTATSLEAAFVTYGASIGAAIAASATHTPVPPAQPVGWLSLFDSLATQEPSHEDAAAAYADAIHDWAVSGTATLNAPPATTLNWNGAPPT